MKENKRLLPILTFTIAAATLFSCTLFQTLDNSGVNKDAFYKAETTSFSLKDYYGQLRGAKQVKLPSTGNQKLLVVLVHFEDSLGDYNSIKKDTENAFFGGNNSTGYFSVKDYYKKSSYNKLTISGEVIEHQTSKTANQIKRENRSSQTPITLINEIYADLSIDKTKEYDQDNDGYIDAMYVVYNYPFSEDVEEQFFWAFVTNTNMKENIDKPTVNTYAWSSSDFMYVQKEEFGGLNTETYIHEFGHILGLDDYYDYDGIKSPLGSHDMMDNNRFDHNAYSKFLLGWSNPYVIKDTTALILKPSVLYGESALINLNWNNSPYDEYLLIEYFTSASLNAKHQGFMYKTKDTADYQRPISRGVRIYHVDSRIYRVNGDSYYEQIDNVEGLASNEYALIGASNTKSHSSTSFNLITQLDKNGNQNPNYYTSSDYLAGNDSLFVKNDEISQWDNYMETKSQLFNNGNQIGFNITIDVMTSQAVKISFTRV